MQEYKDYKVLAWFRWITGVVVGVFIAVVIMNITIRDNAYQHCLDTTLATYHDSQSWYKEAEKNLVLADNPLLSDVEERQYREASKIHELTANRITRLTASTLQSRETLCQRRYPQTFPLSVFN